MPTELAINPMKSGRNCLYMRIAVTLLSCLSAYFAVIPSHPDFFHPAPVTFVLEIVGIVAAGLIFVLSFSSRSMLSSELWKRPSWYLSPFDRKQPIVFFDFASYCVASYGLGGAVVSTFGPRPNWSWEIPVSAGIGVWLGVRLSLLVFRGRMERANHVSTDSS